MLGYDPKADYYNSKTTYWLSNAYVLYATAILSTMPSDEDNPCTSATIKASATMGFLWQLSSVVFDQVNGVVSSENNLFNTVYNRLTSDATPCAQQQSTEDPIIHSYLKTVASLKKINFPDHLIPDAYIPAHYRNLGPCAKPTRAQEESNQYTFSQYANFVIDEVKTMQQATSNRFAQFFTSCELSPAQYAQCHNAAMNRIAEANTLLMNTAGQGSTSA